MNFIALYIGASAVVVAVFAVAAFRKARMAGRISKYRGTAPGQGDTLIAGDYTPGSSGGGHATVTRVSRDPQEYAKGFVPPNAKQD